MTLHVYDNIEQRSPEWFAARAGIVTASVVGKRLAAISWQGHDGGLAGDVGCEAWDVLCALALPYADHAHYREEWRP